METFAEVSLLVVAGFLLFCFPLGMFTWYFQRSQRLWLATAVWSFCIAGVALATAVITADRGDPNFSAGWYSVRHVLFGATVLAFVWVIQEMSNRRQGYLFGILIALVVIRGVLWFTTDLIWTGAVGPDGTLVYGPIRNPIGLAIGAITLGIAIRAVSRPWPSQQTRQVAAWVLIPTVVLGTMQGSLPAETSDYTSVFIFAIPVLVVQAQLLYRSSVDAHRSNELQRRESLLAAFGTRALEVGGTAPAQGAVDLVVEVAGAGRCEYLESVGGQVLTVASAGIQLPEVSRGRFAALVEEHGRPVGELVAWGDLDADDELYIRSVSLMLSAATSRSAMEADARERALHHSLTGLPNWLLLKDRLAQLLVRRQNRLVVLLCIDVEDMKSINDEYGHEGGDEILREIARRLSSITDDRATVAHIGADEFAVAQIVDDKSQSVILSARISAIGHQPLDFGGQSIRFSVRVGLALAEDDKTEPDLFIRDAEMALM